MFKRIAMFSGLVCLVVNANAMVLDNATLVSHQESKSNLVTFSSFDEVKNFAHPFSVNKIIGTENIDVTTSLNTDTITVPVNTNVNVGGTSVIDITNQTSMQNYYYMIVSLSVSGPPTKYANSEDQVRISAPGHFNIKRTPSMTVRFSYPGTYVTGLTVTLRKMDTNQVYTYSTQGRIVVTN